MLVLVLVLVLGECWPILAWCQSHVQCLPVYFQSKCLEKDEKRNLKKLTLVTDEKTVAESRELTVRLDLDPGHYLMVPYTSGLAQEGEFLIRILCEKEQTSGKTGW